MILEVVNSSIAVLESLHTFDICILLASEQSSIAELQRNVSVTLSTEPGKYNWASNEPHTCHENVKFTIMYTYVVLY